MPQIIRSTQRNNYKLGYAGYAAAGATNHYTTPTNIGFAEITRIRIVNVHPSNTYASVKVWVGPSATDRYVELATITLAFGDSVETAYENGQMGLEALQKFWAQADRADDIAIHLHVNEVI